MAAKKMSLSLSPDSGTTHLFLYFMETQAVKCRLIKNS